MRRMTHGTKKTLSLCLALLMLSGAACAEGLLPSMNQMFGTAMPSIGLALDRTADETGEDADGKWEVYHTFSYDDYTAFGAYLAGTGAALKNTEATGSVITITLTVRGETMRFAYDWVDQTATAIYPSGTRPETEKEAVEIKASILPPVGGIMPSAQFALNRKPSNEIADDTGITQVWTDFTDADYSAFSIYLAKAGAKLLHSDIEAGVLIAEIGLNGSSFTLTYNWHEKILAVFYPSGTSPEREKWNTIKGLGSILPKMDTIGKELPSMSQALSRLPDAIETLADGSRKEVYNNFGETEYGTFSQYLLTAGCAVDDYHVEDGSVMVIALSNITGSFTFTYDALHHTGTVVYPKGSQIEAAWAAPVATPEPTVTATPKPTQNYYSQSECWNAALSYFRNLSWRNPSSLTIHGHTSSHNTSDHTYTFYIDYSAQNGFGGYNRKTGIIVVSEITCSVRSAFVD